MSYGNYNTLVDCTVSDVVSVCRFSYLAVGMQSLNWRGCKKHSQGCYWDWSVWVVKRYWIGWDFFPTALVADVCHCWAYKIIRGIDTVNLFPRVGVSKSRRPSFNVKRLRFEGAAFSHRGWLVCGQASGGVEDPGTMVMFKRHLDRYMERKCLEGYLPNAAKLEKLR